MILEQHALQAGRQLHLSWTDPNKGMRPYVRADKYAVCQLVLEFKMESSES